MPKTKKPAKKKKKSDPRFEQFWTGGPAKIDPRLIRQAVVEVIGERRKREAEEKARKQAQANGRSHEADSQ